MQTKAVAMKNKSSQYVFPQYVCQKNVLVLVLLLTLCAIETHVLNVCVKYVLHELYLYISTVH